MGLLGRPAPVERALIDGASSPDIERPRVPPPAPTKAAAALDISALVPRRRLDRWHLWYCGEAPPVVADLRPGLGFSPRPVA